MGVEFLNALSMFYALSPLQGRLMFSARRAEKDLQQKLSRNPDRWCKTYEC